MPPAIIVAAVVFAPAAATVVTVVAAAVAATIAAAAAALLLLHWGLCCAALSPFHRAGWLLPVASPLLLKSLHASLFWLIVVYAAHCCGDAMLCN